MSKFKVGDRVAVYDMNQWGRATGKITEVAANKKAFCTVTLDSEWAGWADPDGEVGVHPKQCRLLPPKKKKEVIEFETYVDPNTTATTLYNPIPFPIARIEAPLELRGKRCKVKVTIL